MNSHALCYTRWFFLILASFTNIKLLSARNKSILWSYSSFSTYHLNPLFYVYGRKMTHDSGAYSPTLSARFIQQYYNIKLSHSPLLNCSQCKCNFIVLWCRWRYQPTHYYVNNISKIRISPLTAGLVITGHRSDTEHWLTPLPPLVTWHMTCTIIL